MKQDEFIKEYKEYKGDNPTWNAKSMFKFFNHLLSNQKPSVSDEEIKNKAEETYKHSIIEERAFQNGAKWALSITPPDAEKWISVEERLPEEKFDAWHKDGYRVTNCNAKGLEKGTTIKDYMKGMGYVYWMPLPKPPINKQGGK